MKDIRDLFETRNYIKKYPFYEVEFDLADTKISVIYTEEKWNCLPDSFFYLILLIKDYNYIVEKEEDLLLYKSACLAPGLNSCAFDNFKPNTNCHVKIKYFDKDGTKDLVLRDVYYQDNLYEVRKECIKKFVIEAIKEKMQF